MDKLKITCLAGGVGGAKLVYGLSKVLPPEALSVVVNTGDDFNFYGLHISPDIDSVIYSLAEMSDKKNGFGRGDDSFNAINSLKELGEDVWFNLGDKDLGVNLYRTQLINSGYKLDDATKKICRLLGLEHSILPMTNDPVFTRIITSENEDISFQEYFVKKHFQPAVKEIYYSNSELSKISEDVVKKINSSNVIIICPSNPWLSIFPILKLPGFTDLISKKLILAVSPIIGDDAVKGPTAKLFYDFGLKPCALGIASLYKDLISILVIDVKNKYEEESIKSLGITPLVTDIMMPDEYKKIRLADEIIKFIRNLA
jgi:LPPG:FO 2-phospho-L-lactate transferase